MHGNGDKKGFKGMEEWKREHENKPGGGEILGAKGMRYDDHSDKAREIQERKRQSGQSDGSMKR